MPTTINQTLFTCFKGREEILDLRYSILNVLRCHGWPETHAMSCQDGCYNKAGTYTACNLRVRLHSEMEVPLGGETEQSVHERMATNILMENRG